MPSALSARERAYLERKIRRSRLARPFKWSKFAAQILATMKRFFHKAKQALCGEL
jgi:hypothetical protein